MTQQEIINKCSEDTTKVFYLLRKDNFKLAKEFWGEGLVCMDCGQSFTEKDRIVGNMGMVHFFCCDCGDDVQPNKEEAWEHYLPIMILEKDEMKYLRRFVK